ncbi:MAG: hypothetical protein WDO14_01690 [Bacteroidota bacterium]
MEKLTKELIEELAKDGCTVVPASEWVPVRYSPEMQKRIDEIKEWIKTTDLSKLPPRRGPVKS